MPSSKGTVLLTGANGGIAVGFVSHLLKSPYATSYKGYYTVRDPNKADSLANIMEQHAAHDHDYEIATLDMSTLDTVRSAATAINMRVLNGSLPPIHALVLNAGIQDFVQQDFTKDGIERTFAINYLHNFLLVLLLLQSMDKEHGRIVFIGSTAIYPDWAPHAANYPEEEDKTFFTTVDELAKGERRSNDDKAGPRHYAMSKVMMIMFM